MPAAAPGPRIALRPLAAEDAPELVRILRTPEVARWWDDPDPGFPLADDPDATRLTIEVDGAVAGLAQYGEELDPKYRHASIDLFLGRGRRYSEGSDPLCKRGQALYLDCGW